MLSGIYAYPQDIMRQSDPPEHGKTCTRAAVCGRDHHPWPPCPLVPLAGPALRAQLEQPVHHGLVASVSGARAEGCKWRPRRGFGGYGVAPFGRTVGDGGQEGPPTPGLVPGPTCVELCTRKQATRQDTTPQSTQRRPSCGTRARPQPASGRPNHRSPAAVGWGVRVGGELASTGSSGLITTTTCGQSSNPSSQAELRVTRQVPARRSAPRPSHCATTLPRRACVRGA